ncbi:hypothetical protein [Streptosporangium sp. OZ121]
MSGFARIRARWVAFLGGWTVVADFVHETGERHGGGGVAVPVTF